MIEIIKLEKGVPIPTGRYEPRIYPLDEMQVGDSFAVDASDGKRAYAVRAAVFRYKSMSKGKKFVTRLRNGKLRVWRTK